MSEETIVQLSAPAFELMKQYEKENKLYLDILTDQTISPEEKQIMKELIQSNRKYKLIEEGMWMGFVLLGALILKSPSTAMHTIK